MHALDVAEVERLLSERAHLIKAHAQDEQRSFKSAGFTIKSFDLCCFHRNESGTPGNQSASRQSTSARTRQPSGQTLPKSGPEKSWNSLLEHTVNQLDFCFGEA